MILLNSFDPFHRGAHIAHVPAHDSQSLWGITENDMKSLFALLFVVWKLEGSTSLRDLGKVSYLKMIQDVNIHGCSTLP